MFLKPSPERSLASLTSHGILSNEPWRRLKQKVSRHRWQKAAATNGSSATVDSSDIKVGDGISAAACNDLNYPWGHQIKPIILEPAFYEALDQLLHRFKYQSIPSNDDHYKAHGAQGHKINSRKPEERNHKGKSTRQDARHPGSGGGGKGSGGKGGDGEPPPDGHRYPPRDEVQLPKIFGCPFHITDPVQYHECGNFRLRRLSDVFQHIERCHLLQEVKLCTPRGAEAARKNGNEKGACTDSNLIKIYDATCRQEFHGPRAEGNFKLHCASKTCQPKTIEETGMLLPEEFEDLKDKRDRAKGLVAKWYAMWMVCFPPLTSTKFRTVPASPYVQTIFTREAGQMVILQVLSGFGISTEYHRPMSDQIVNGLYPVQFQADSEVQQAVKDQQRKRNSMLQDAEFEEFCRSTFNSSELTSPGFPSAGPSQHQSQQQMPEQPSNGTVDLSNSLSRQLQMSQGTYRGLPSYFPPSETQAPPEMANPVYQQYMEWEGYYPPNGFTGNCNGTR
ncbi:uncharacterized protein BKA55DRAFT_567224 [Fusarium redolens]|uniref:Uncharacterized protein n=1 Tax=Fusarium redolens TaxID=48865 RepID=A0A9P9HBT8_FUSRE|nr:uncharacterized protein BKA55DRAFT_567224 [Fusarium redolens]KAH7254222.1 hypothetical protein BKA55DRAFT_567224 [Fusarium redolens]